MRKLLKFTRHAEWWEYKLVPLLSVAYATVLVIDCAPALLLARIGMLLLAIINGAVYVSVINDITDIDEDAAAGKTNRMAALSKSSRGIIVALCLLLAVVFGFLIYPDLTSLSFYIMAYVVFSLYSIPPVRLKKRGFFGVLCDATGAHFFPAMLMATNLAYVSKTSVSILWFAAIGVWSLCYGLRGILWHQFFDRDNDLQSGTTTYAAGIAPADFTGRESVIFFFEIIAFTAVIAFTCNIWIIISMILYLILIAIRRLCFNYQVCLIITPPSLPHQILMNDYYLVLFPLAILFTFAMHFWYGWILLCVHLILFPRKTLLILVDLLSFLRLVKSKLS